MHTCGCCFEDSPHSGLRMKFLFLTRSRFAGPSYEPSFLGQPPPPKPPGLADSCLSIRRLLVGGGPPRPPGVASLGLSYALHVPSLRFDHVGPNEASPGLGGPSRKKGCAYLCLRMPSFDDVHICVTTSRETLC
jgi:hypothetical protein